MAVVAYNHVQDSGLDEGLLELTERVYGIVRHLSDVLGMEDGQCSEYFAMYAVLRSEGKSPREASEGLKALLAALVRGDSA